MQCLKNFETFFWIKNEDPNETSQRIIPIWLSFMCNKIHLMDLEPSLVWPTAGLAYGVQALRVIFQPRNIRRFVLTEALLIIRRQIDLSWCTSTWYKSQLETSLVERWGWRQKAFWLKESKWWKHCIISQNTFLSISGMLIGKTECQKY